MNKKELYPNNLENRLLGLGQAPIIDYRKLIPIGLIGTNLAWPAVIDSRELSLKPKTRISQLFGYLWRTTQKRDS